MSALVSTPYQLLPPLTAEERAALIESIGTFGILQPIIVDEAGNVIDGHHRAEIAAELGVDCPRTVLPDLTEEQKVEQSIALNLGRRHLTRGQRRELIRKLIEAEPEASDRHVARLVGADHKTVGAIRRELSGEIPQPAWLRFEGYALEFEAMDAALQAAATRFRIGTGEDATTWLDWPAFAEFTTTDPPEWASDLGQYSLRYVSDWLDCDEPTFELVRMGEEARGDPLPFDWHAAREAMGIYESLARALEAADELGDAPSFDEWRAVIEQWPPPPRQLSAGAP